MFDSLKTVALELAYLLGFDPWKKWYQPRWWGGYSFLMLWMFSGVQLTENYGLGIGIFIIGFRSAWLCVSTPGADSSPESSPQVDSDLNWILIEFWAVMWPGWFLLAICTTSLILCENSLMYRAVLLTEGLQTTFFKDCAKPPFWSWCQLGNLLITTSCQFPLSAGTCVHNSETTSTC